MHRETQDFICYALIAIHLQLPRMTESYKTSAFLD